MKILRYVISAILSFLIIFGIFSLLGINILNDKILNKTYVKQKMKETEFNVQVAREIKDGFEKYIYQSGFPVDIIDNLFTNEMLQNDIDSIVDFVYGGKEISLSSETLRSTLDQKIQDYASSQNLTLNEQNKNNIKKFENLIVDEYDNNVNVSTSVYKQANSAVKDLNKINDKVKNLPITILIILIAALVIINIKDLLTAINFLGISLLSSGVIIKIGVGLFFSNVDIDNIVFLSTSISNLIISVLKEIIYGISDRGNIFVVCGIVAIIASAIIKNIKSESTED